MPMTPLGDMTAIVGAVNTARIGVLQSRGTDTKHAELDRSVAPSSAREAQHEAIAREPRDLADATAGFHAQHLLLAQNEENGTVALVNGALEVISEVGQLAEGQVLTPDDFGAIVRDLEGELVAVEAGHSVLSFPSTAVLCERLTQAGTPLSA